MTADIPLRKQFQLAAQQSLVVWRQHAFARGELPAQQRVRGVAKELVGVAGIERAQICGRAQVGQQQEAAREILRENLRRIESGVAHQRSDVHERPAILARRRRIHRDQRRGSRRHCSRRLQRHAEIAAEARILRRWRQCELLRTQGFRQPFGQEDEARIGGRKTHGQRRNARTASKPARLLQELVGLECGILANRLRRPS